MLAPVRNRNMCSITYAGVGLPHIKIMEEILSILKLVGLKSSTYSCHDFLEACYVGSGTKSKHV